MVSDRVNRGNYRMKCECGDCDWTGPEEDLGAELCDVEDLFQRIDPGSEVPAGECPECGCLAYIVPEENVYASSERGLLEAMKRIRCTSVKETFHGNVEQFQEWLDGFTDAAIAKATVRDSK